MSALFLRPRRRLVLRGLGHEHTTGCILIGPGHAGKAVLSWFLSVIRPGSTGLPSTRW